MAKKPIIFYKLADIFYLDPIEPPFDGVSGDSRLFSYSCHNVEIHNNFVIFVKGRIQYIVPMDRVMQVRAKVIDVKEDV